MPLRNGIPFIWRPKGLSDAIDGTNAFDGAMASLSNLNPDPTTEGVWVPRPPAMSATTFSGFSSPGFVSSELIIGNRVYGTLASARNSGKDEPYCYDLQAAAFVTVSNITNANTPTQPPTTGDWTPPILFQAGSRIIVTHPGFPGGNTKFGWFDVSGFSTTTLGDTVNGSAIITGNPQVLGMQPGLAITGAGIAGSTTILTTAQAFTGISVTANTHSNFTMDSISPNTAAMRVGFQVIGPGIQPFTTITSITSGSAIQLSQATTSSVTGQSFYVLGPPTSPLSYLNVTLTAGSPTVATSDTTGVWTGQIVTDPTGGIPPGSIVVSVNPGVSFTINQNATLTGQTGSVQLTGTVIILSANATATADNITFNVSGGSFAAPQWGAGDTQPNNLPSVPVGGAQMNGRAYYACGTDGIAFSDSLFPCQISDNNQVQALKPNDGLAVTAIGPSSLASLVGGQVQSLYAFEGIFKIQQITGDPDTNNLAMNALPVATGTLAPLTLTPMEHGLAFISPEGLRILDLIGRVSPPIGDHGTGIAAPFIYALNPSRMCAAATSDTIRITVHNGNKVSQPYEEYWYDLTRKIWHGPHTSTASLIQPWQDQFVLTLVGVNAELFTSAAVPQPPGGGYVENGKQLVWQYEPVYLMPDIGDMAMRSVIQMTLACGGPDCDPTAAPENLLYTPPAVGQPPVGPGTPSTLLPPNQPPPPPYQPPAPFAPLAVVLAGAQTMWDFPTMMDAPSGILSFWAYIATQTPAGNHPGIFDFYSSSGGISSILTGPSEAGVDIRPTFAGTPLPITNVTSALQAVITVAGIVPGGVTSLTVNSIAQSGWSVGISNIFNIISIAGNDITVNWDTHTFSPYSAGSNAGANVNMFYATGITSANPMVVTTSEPHGLDASVGNLWVIFGFNSQATWSGLNGKSLLVTSSTFNTLTISHDTSTFPAYVPADSPGFNMTVVNSTGILLRNSGNSDEVQFYSPTPLPVGKFVNVLMSWDTNHAAGSKKVSLAFGDTVIPPYFLQDVSPAFAIPYSNAGSGQSTWQVSGPGNSFDSSGQAYLAEYYWNAGAAFMDFSVAGNRAKFHTGSVPVDLGSDGSGPTGSPPTAYLSLRSGDRLEPPPALAWWEPNGVYFAQSPGVLGGIMASTSMVLSFWVDRNSAITSLVAGAGLSVSWDNEDAPFTMTVSLNDASNHFFIFTFPYDGVGGVNIRMSVDTNHIIGSKVVVVYVGTSTAAVTVTQDDVNNLLVDWQDGSQDFVVLAGATGWFSEIWFGPGQLFDVSSKFIDGSGNPVDLGAHGELPSGTSPAVFCHLNAGQPVIDLNTNLGTGGNFTGAEGFLATNGTRFTDNLSGNGSLRLATGPLLLAPINP